MHGVDGGARLGGGLVVRIGNGIRWDEMRSMRSNLMMFNDWHVMNY